MGRAEIVAPGASGEAVFSGFMEKWRSSVQTDKMVRRGRLSIHLQKASKLSKEWGGGQFSIVKPSNMPYNTMVRCRVNLYSLFNKSIKQFAPIMGFSSVETKYKFIEVITEMFMANCSLMGAHKPSFQK
jgi:hypothetical protein